MTREEKSGVTNPFSTARIRPGVIPYRSVDGQTINELAEAFGRAGCIGQILGPHGSGKSTLLVQLGAVLSSRRSTRLVHVRPKDRFLWWRRWEISTERLSAGESGEGTGEIPLVLVDGFDALSWLTRRALIRHAARHHCGLIVTSHAPQPMPILCRTRADMSTFVEIVEQLTAGFPALISAQRVREAFQRHAPNMREALFELYDVYESLRKSRKEVSRDRYAVAKRRA